MVPTMFGISFTATFMNQAGALVHVYLDGTVLVSHGGTEMGQGLHTKLTQVAARAFGVPMDQVYVAETATDKVPNSSPTAASASSDMYGMAVLNACEQILQRLAPFRAAAKATDTFQDIITQAYFQRVNLSAQGFYRMHVTGYDFVKELDPGTVCNSERGRPFAYFTFGAACCEVEIDVLTGDLRIIRADVCMDVGNSLNPAIDIGQIEGAFAQGVGWATMEELVWGSKQEVAWLPEGACFTRGPGTYKIPSFNDTPSDLRVVLLKDNANPAAIHSSRAIGEPPLFLGCTARFAARKAIASARADAKCPAGYFELQSPLTAERIRMACGDDVAARFGPKAKDGGGGAKDGQGKWRPALWC